MERRQALRVLGTSLAAVAGCMGQQGSSGSPSAAGTTVQPVATSLEDRRFSTFDEYGPESATVRLTREDSWAILERDTDVRVAVAARRYPRGEVLTWGLSERLSDIAEPAQTVRVEFDSGTLGFESADVESEAASNESESAQETDATETHIHYVATLGAGDTDLDSPPTGGRLDRENRSSSPNGSGGATAAEPRPGVNPAVIAETDRLMVGEDGSVAPDPHPLTLGDGSKPGFRRTAVEGAYHLELSGEAVDWTVPVRVFKAEYVSGATGWHGHDYPPYVDQARQSGLAGRVATAIRRAAIALDREPLDFAIEVVQRLPYVSEPDSREDEYIKYPSETVVEAGGDCEDSALLLGSLLTGPPFDRTCAIVHPPNHVGLGLAGEGYVGTYYSHEGTAYFFVEATAPGWSIGELPDEYASDTALVFPV